jgi:hypothetical protein
MNFRRIQDYYREWFWAVFPTIPELFVLTNFNATLLR